MIGVDYLESKRLQVLLREYERLKHAGKAIEAMSFLPSIRKACEKQGLNWSVVLGLENGFIFTDENGNNTVTKTVTTVSYGNENGNFERLKNGKIPENEVFCKCGCGKSLQGKRKSALFYSAKCKSNFHQKKTLKRDGNER